MLESVSFMMKVNRLRTATLGNECAGAFFLMDILIIHIYKKYGNYSNYIDSACGSGVRGWWLLSDSAICQQADLERG